MLVRANVLPRWAGAVVGGGLLCVLGDHLHVVRGVLTYPNPVLWGQAWWVLPLFGAATLLALVLARRVYPDPAPKAHPFRVAALDLAVFCAAYAFTAFEEARPNTILGVLVGLWILRVALRMPRLLALFCVFVAVSGTTWEAVWSGLGFFTYKHPDFMGVPRWLPALYLHAAIAADSARTALDTERAPAR